MSELLVCDVCVTDVGCRLRGWCGDSWGRDKNDPPPKEHCAWLIADSSTTEEIPGAICIVCWRYPEDCSCKNGPHTHETKKPLAL